MSHRAPSVLPVLDLRVDRAGPLSLPPAFDPVTAFSHLTRCRC